MEKKPGLTMIVGMGGRKPSAPPLLNDFPEEPMETQEEQPQTGAPCTNASFCPFYKADGGEVA